MNGWVEDWMGGGAIRGPAGPRNPFLVFHHPPDQPSTHPPVRTDRPVFVVDGVEGKEYDGIAKGTPIFSSDSKRVAYRAQRGRKQFVVLDGVQGKEYEAFLRGSRLVFDRTTLLHTLGHRAGEFFRVEVDIVAE